MTLFLRVLEFFRLFGYTLHTCHMKIGCLRTACIGGGALGILEEGMEL